MEFSVLGPLEVRAGGEPVRLGSGKLRFLLATLLCRSNTVVSTGRLTQALWWGDPPRTAVKNLQVNVHHLRRVLQETDAAPRIISRPGGYLLTTAPQEVDVDRFDVLADAAGAEVGRGQLERADVLFQRALALWRGRAFAGLERADLIQQESLRLTERRLTVAEAAIDVRLGLGRHTEALAELEPLVAEHPYRERLRAQQMTALYRTGRQVEALAVFDDVRRLLAEELGLRPGSMLRQLQQIILDGRRDAGFKGAALKEAEFPGLSAAGPQARLRGGNAGQLPPGIGDLVARPVPRAVLRTLLTPAAASAARTGDQSGAQPGAQAPQLAPTAEWTLLVVSGPPGAGKSTLAADVARSVAGHYADGLLYLDLRTPDGQPHDPAEALAELLRVAGVPSGSVPAAPADRLRMYRELLYGRQALVLLDNAVDEAQIRCLLPTTGACGTVVTSCSRLSGLAGARLVEIGEFRHDEALELLTRIVGRQRVAAEPEAAERILRCCGFLPLAVRIAGTRLAARPHWPLSKLVHLLEGPGGLDELVVGDLDLRNALRRGHHGIPAADLRAAARLGALPAADFGVPESAALLQVSLERAEELLERLCDLHLVRPNGRTAPTLMRYQIPRLLQHMAD